MKFNENSVNSKLSFYGKSFDPEMLSESINLKNKIWETEITPIILGELPAFAEVVKDVLNLLNI